MQLKGREVKVGILEQGVGEEDTVCLLEAETTLSKNKVGVRIGDREGRCKHKWVMERNMRKH